MRISFMMLLQVLFRVLYSLHCIDAVIVTERSLSEEENLYTHLIDNYGKRVRPVENSSDTVNITVLFVLMQLIKLDEPLQRIEISGMLNMQWKDPKLGWRHKAYGGLSRLSVPSATVWIPDIGQFNSITGMYDLSVMGDYHIQLFPKGDTLWIAGGVFSAPCQMDISLFPFDSQVCTFIFQSWGQTKDQLRLFRGSDVNLKHYTQDSQWQLLSSSIEVRQERLSQSLEVAKDVLYVSLTYRRDSTYFMVNIVAPCCLLSLMILGIFLLPPESGEKIGFGITILLAFTVFALIIAESLPKSSVSTALLSKYLLFLMSMSGLSILCSVAVINIHTMCVGESRLPAWAKMIFFGPMAKMTLLSSAAQKFRGSMSNNEVGPEEVSPKYQEVEKVVSGNLNPGGDMTQNPTEHLIDALLKELRKNSRESEKNKRQEDYGDEWKMAARVMDRFLFIVCLIVEVMVAIVCLLILPNVS